MILLGRSYTEISSGADEREGSDTSSCKEPSAGMKKEIKNMYLSSSHEPKQTQELGGKLSSLLHKSC